MARPKLAVVVRRYYINLTLREGEDDDLIAFLDRVPLRQRVRAIKSALRAGPLSVDEHRERLKKPNPSPDNV
jgi:hypothetical protein